MKKIIYSTLALLAFASCQKEDISGGVKDPNTVEITASVGENSLFGTRSNPTSDTAEECKTFNNGDQIAVSNGSLNGKWATYTKGDNGWASDFAGGDYLRWEADQMTYKAYYPAGGTTTYDYFKLPNLQNRASDIASADYMKVEAVKNQADGAVSLEFVRQTALIKVTIGDFGGEYDGLNPIVSSVRVVSSKREIGGDAGGIWVEPRKKGNSFYAIVIPTEASANDQFIEIEVIDDNSLSPTYLYVKGVPATEAGKRYEYTVKVGKEKAEISSVTVSDWATGDIINGDTEDMTEGIIFKSKIDPQFLDILKTIDGIDANSDGMITENEVAAVSKLDLDYSSEFSFKGIEYFTGLMELSFVYNNITTINLSANTELTLLNCTGNSLTTLDVSMLPNLISLYADSQLDANGNPQQITVIMTQAQVDAGVLMYETGVIVQIKE